MLLSGGGKWAQEVGRDSDDVPAGVRTSAGVAHLCDLSVEFVDEQVGKAVGCCCRTCLKTIYTCAQAQQAQLGTARSCDVDTRTACTHRKVCNSPACASCSRRCACTSTSALLNIPAAKMLLVDVAIPACSCLSLLLSWCSLQCSAYSAAACLQTVVCQNRCNYFFR